MGRGYRHRIYRIIYIIRNINFDFPNGVAELICVHVWARAKKMSVKCSLCEPQINKTRESSFDICTLGRPVNKSQENWRNINNVRNQLETSKQPAEIEAVELIYENGVSHVVTTKEADIHAVNKTFFQINDIFDNEKFDNDWFSVKCYWVMKWWRHFRNNLL